VGKRYKKGWRSGFKKVRGFLLPSSFFFSEGRTIVFEKGPSGKMKNVCVGPWNFLFGKESSPFWAKKFPAKFPACPLKLTLLKISGLSRMSLR
jgi:hypothetical protein